MTAEATFEPPEPDVARGPDSSAITEWLLEGRYVTVDAGGAVSAWSEAAAEVFGWAQRDVVGASFLDALVAERDRAAKAPQFESLLCGGAASFTEELVAVAAGNRIVRATIAVVAIPIASGYEFNALLRELSMGRRDDESLAAVRTRHQSVLALIESALTGPGDKEEARLAGALVVFDAMVVEDLDDADNVVHITEAGVVDTRRALEELRSVQGHLAESRREAQRARAEAEAARQQLGDTRDALRDAERAGGDTRRGLEQARGEAEDARAAAEAARIRAEDSTREADALRRDLVEARELARVAGGKLEAAVAGAAQAREQADAARADLDRSDRVFEQAAVGALLTDANGRIVRVNRALCTMLGHSRERLLADDPPPLVHPDDVDSRHALSRRIASGEQGIARGYRRYLDVEGHAVTMRETVTLVRDDRAEPFLFLFQLEDAGAVEVVVDAEVAPDEHDALPASESPAGEEVRRALAEDRFVLYAQPVVDLSTNKVSQYELLLRMRAEDGRLVLPNAFLEAARRAGLAPLIDQWVVTHAIALLAARQTDNLTLEVNLSPEAIYDPDLPTLIDEQLASTAIDPARLVLEVTGATAVSDLERTRVLAKRVRALGCRFALDDFRSTFGSFRLLKELPLDYLKLDGELVSSVAESRSSQLIVKALVDVGRALDMRTVAVFVSDEELLRALRLQGVDCAQGYAVGRPLPAQELWPDDRAALPPGD